VTTTGSNTRLESWRRVQPWVSLAVRLGLAATFLIAAIPKLTDLQRSREAVAAYDLFPPAIDQLIGVSLPIVELVLALLVLSGLLTRYAAGVLGVMLVAFIAGIISAWARGLMIKCGCFGPGGALGPDEVAEYGLEILRDIGFLALAVFVVIWPCSRFSLDNVLDLNPAPRNARRQLEDQDH
jgi:uncharacterized membrane protein YphA (DoxX/SURF4 family)